MQYMLSRKNQIIKENAKYNFSSEDSGFQSGLESPNNDSKIKSQENSYDCQKLDYQKSNSESSVNSSQQSINNLNTSDPCLAKITPQTQLGNLELRSESKPQKGIKSISQLNAAQFFHLKPLALRHLNKYVMKIQTKNNDNNKIVQEINNFMKNYSKSKNSISNLFSKFSSKFTNSVPEPDEIPKNSLEYYTLNYGSAFPPLVVYAIKHLGNIGISSPGVFRKSGNGVKINYLYNIASEEITNDDWTKYSVYEWADFLKLFLKNLNTPIINRSFVRIYSYIKDYDELERINIFRYLFFLMSDENREALHYILRLLKKISENSDQNLMDSKNLAICFSPCLCPIELFDSSNNYNNNLQKNSRSNNNINSLMSALEESEKLITYLIDNIDNVFELNPDTFSFINLEFFLNYFPMNLYKLGSNETDKNSNYEKYIDNSINQLFKEHKNEFKSWKNECILKDIPILSRKEKDDYPLLLYRGYIDLDVACSELFAKYLYNSNLWNGNTERYVIKKLTDCSDLFYQKFRTHNSVFFDRNFILLRKWNFIQGSCYLSTTSVEISQKDLLESPHDFSGFYDLLSNKINKRAFILSSNLVVEPFEEKSRVTLIMRIDLRGKDSCYYKNITPYIISQELGSLKAFEKGTKFHKKL